MATLDLNNSYWAQKLLRFKEGGRILPARSDGSGDGIETLVLETAGPATARPSAAVYVGALALLVAEYSAKEELLIAEPVPGESTQHPPLFYACQIDRKGSVASFVAAVETEMQVARAHRPYQFKSVAALVELNEEALFQISFSAGMNGQLPALIPAAGLAIAVAGDGPAAQLTLSYDARQFSREWAEQFRRHYLRTIRFFTTDESARVSDLDLLSDDEKQLVAVAFNQTQTDYPADKTLHALLERQAAKTPDAPAVIFNDCQLTYRELNEQANQLAHFLREHLHVRTGEIIGAMMTRSEKMVVALLAIMKAGAAYVPINPRHPWATINYMIENARIRTLLVDTEAVSQAATFDGELFIIDVELDGLTTPPTNPAVAQASTDLAYVIYTSGSTGRPKGVAVEHRAIVNTILWRNDYYGFDDRDVNLQMPSFAFDSSVLDIFCVLVAGGCLLIPQDELRLDAQYLKALILGRGVTRLILTPSYYRVLMQELGGDNPLRSITVAGEATTAELVEDHARRMPGVLLYNEYGPTENAVCSTACVLRPGAKTVSIGRPIANVKVFILDESLNLRPPGLPGEIYLGGAGLARGYLHQEALTEERFIASPIPEFYQGRLYRTGDWGSWQPDGEVEFLGRIDNQVKIRGFRIELDEIESRLLGHPAVEHAAVVCKEEGGGNYLAAYLAVRDGLTVDELRGYLGGQLPQYMIPEVIRILTEMPLTLNGKVDRARLKSFNDRQEKATGDLPENETESALATICADLLRINRPGAGDNFFDHGLNSLKVMEMISRIRNEIGVDVSLLDVYTFPTIQALSRRIGAARWNSEMTKTVSST